MIHTIGIILLAAGAAMIGLLAVGHLKARVRDLRCMVAGLSALRRELGYYLLPLPEGLARAAGETSGNAALFFELAAQGARHLNGRAFRDVWCQATEAGQLRLEPADLYLIEQLGGVLGRYDIDSQCRALDLALEKLSVQQTEAEDQSRCLGKLYSVLGLAAGGFLLVLLI